MAEHFLTDAGNIHAPLLAEMEERGGQQVKRTVDTCADCVGCPLLKECQSPQSKGGWTITREEHEPARPRVAA